MSNQDIDDPFAQFDDLDSFDNDFDQGADLDTQTNNALADDFGDDMSLDAADDDMGMADDEVSDAAPGKPAPSSTPVVSPGATPFLKTPLGMATIGLAVVGVMGGAGAVFMSGNSEEVIAPETAAVVPQASEPNFSEPVPQAPAVVAPAVETTAAITEPALVAQPPATQAPLNQLNNVPAEVEHVGQLTDADSAELKEFISEQRAEMKQLNSALSALTEEIQGIKVQMNQNANADKALKDSLDSLSSKLEKNVEAVSADVVSPVSTTTATQPLVNAPVKVEQNNALAQGRQRVTDFLVVDATSNGQMVIIKKVSSGRVFTVFKGEVLVIGGKRLSVQSIEGGGTVVLLGDKLYIDKVLAAKPAVEPRTAKVAAKAPLPAKAAAKAPISRDAKGFTLNAVYDSDSSFGVVDNKGNFKSYRVGESVPELGGAKVQGLDASGNLKVGDYVIKSIY